MLLALYWFALTAGRVVAARLLRVVRHGKLLARQRVLRAVRMHGAAGGGHALGVVVGILLTGAGFSAIYPLAAERIASRFPYYHPGYFNGIFTFALTGRDSGAVRTGASGGGVRAAR